MIDCDNVDWKLKTEEITSHAKEWGLVFRIYKSSRGIRAICINEKFRPSMPISDDILFKLGCCDVYRKLVFKQKFYAIRVSAKPNIIGLTKDGDFGWNFYSMLPRDQRSWADQYEELAKKYKVCDFICQTENLEPDQEIKEFIEKHDKECRCEEDLPLA
jgi:hypothetical protein